MYVCDGLALQTASNPTFASEQINENVLSVENHIVQQKKIELTRHDEVLSVIKESTNSKKTSMSINGNGNIMNQATPALTIE